MPSKKPRINLTVPQNLNETISRLAELQGCSRGAVVLDLLEAVHDPLMRTVALLEAAQSAPKQVREGLRETVEQMERELNAQVGGGVSQMDMLLQALREPSGGVQPPHGNTGVRSQSDTPSTSHKEG